MIAIQLALSVLSLLFIIKLFYYKNIPLFLMAGVLMQWLSISIRVFYGIVNGLSLREVFSFYYSPNHIDEAYYLSLIAIVVYALGLKAGLPAYYKKWNLDLVKRELLKLDSTKIVIFYLIYSMSLAFLWRLRYVIPGLNSGMFALSIIKWGVIVIAILAVHYKKDSARLLSIILVVEITLSLASYFSDFKEYFYILIIIYASLEKYYNAGRIFKYILLGALLIQVAIVWTAIKGEYRNYLSGGKHAQSVVVDRSSALTKLYELASNYDNGNANLNQASKYLVDRVGYISFFSLTIDYVPQKRPYENGSIWLDAITFFFMPRLLFPNKPVIDDSKHVNKYTGLSLAGVKEGSSHSVGYIADSYIDFGPYGMFVPIFLLGLITGKLYKYFMTHSYNYLWAIVFTVPFFYLTNINGINAIKVVGNIFIYIVVAFLFNQFLAPRIHKYFLK